MRHSHIRAIIMSVAVAAASAASASDGPLEVVNQFPLLRGLGMPSLEQARCESGFAASLSHSSFVFVHGSASWNARIDMEATELELRARRIVSDGLELSAELPVVTLGSGVLDDPVTAFHRSFGLPDYGRRDLPVNEFSYAVRRNGAVAVAGRSGTSLGDLRLGVKKAFVAESDRACSVKLFVELPTGSGKDGVGNGSVDAGALVAAERRIRTDVLLFGTAGIVQPGDLRAQQTVRLRPYGFAGLGADLRMTDRLSIVGQLSASSSPFAETGIREFDDPTYLFVIGIRHSKDDTAWELSFTEDPNTASAPDFTLNLTYRRRF